MLLLVISSIAFMLFNVPINTKQNLNKEIVGKIPVN